MKKLERINKHTVMAQLRTGKTWSGFIAGDNTNSCHIDSGWYLGYQVEVNSIEELNMHISSFERNLESELGRRAVLWQYVLSSLLTYRKLLRKAYETMKKIQYNYQSHDNGMSWRIIDNWEFQKLASGTVQLAGTYSGKKNFWINARIENGEIVYYNPRNIDIPLYAQKIVAEMLGLLKTAKKGNWTMYALTAKVDDNEYNQMHKLWIDAFMDASDIVREFSKPSLHPPVIDISIRYTETDTLAATYSNGTGWDFRLKGRLQNDRPASSYRSAYLFLGIDNTISLVYSIVQSDFPEKIAKKGKDYK